MPCRARSARTNFASACTAHLQALWLSNTSTVVSMSGIGHLGSGGTRMSAAWRQVAQSASLCPIGCVPWHSRLSQAPISCPSTPASRCARNGARCRRAQPTTAGHSASTMQTPRSYGRTCSSGRRVRRGVAGGGARHPPPSGLCPWPCLCSSPALLPTHCIAMQGGTVGGRNLPADAAQAAGPGAG